MGKISVKGTTRNDFDTEIVLKRLRNSKIGELEAIRMLEECCVVLNSTRLKVKALNEGISELHSLGIKVNKFE